MFRRNGRRYVLDDFVSMVLANFLNDLIEFAVDFGGIDLEPMMGAAERELDFAVIFYSQVQEVMRAENKADLANLAFGRLYHSEMTYAVVWKLSFVVHLTR